MRRVCFPLLAVFACLAGLNSSCEAKTHCTTSNSVSDDPSSVVSIDTTSPEENNKYLVDWTNWDGSNTTSRTDIIPKDPLKSFGAALCSTASFCDGKRHLYMIHIVDWASDANGQVSYVSGKWYLYQTDSQSHYVTVKAVGKAFPPLYDVDNGVLISVSRISLVTNGDAVVSTNAALTPPDIGYTITTTENTPTWLSGLETLVGGFAGPSIGSGTHGGKSRFEPVLTFKTRIKVQNISSDDLHRPFDIAVAAVATGNAPGPAGTCANMTAGTKCNFQQSLSVVARDFVAFGIDIVPHGPAETIYSKDTNGVTTGKKTNHNAFYAVVDFAPLPKTFPMSKYPYFQAGLPLSGAASHLPYAGMAYPVPFFRKQLAVSAFGGFVVMQQQGPTGARDRAIKGLWGVEVPISSFAGAVSQATGDKKSK